MDRSEIIRRSMERGVASALEIDAIYRQLVLCMRDFLREGQDVTVPGFGTFRTRVGGVKAFRRLPEFDPVSALAGRVNERYAGLPNIVIGRFRDVPGGHTFDQAEGSSENAAPTVNELTDVEYERILAREQRSQQQEEVTTMPRLNLKDDSLESEPEPLDSDRPVAPPPTLRDVGGSGGGRGMSTILIVVLILVILGGGVFALNYFNVIHLWGKKTAEISEALPEPDLAPPETGESQEAGQMPPEDASLAPAATVPEPATVPDVSPPATESKPAKEKPSRVAVAEPPSGTGTYTVQVSSWLTRTKADEEAGKLGVAGFSAYVQEATVGGETWYRVRVGRYGSIREAREVIVQLEKFAESELWVAQVAQ